MEAGWHASAGLERTRLADLSAVGETDLSLRDGRADRLRGKLTLLREAMCYAAAAVFNLDSGRILTRTLAGLAAALTISPVAGLRTNVPAFRAGTLRRLTFNRPGKVNSPTPRGCTEPRNTLSNVA